MLFTVIYRSFKNIEVVLCVLWTADCMTIKAWIYPSFFKFIALDIGIGKPIFNTGSSDEFNLCQEPCGNSYWNKQKTGWTAGRYVNESFKYVFSNSILKALNVRWSIVAMPSFLADDVI